ncbi:MAG: cell division protein ZapA [Rhizomicrobium sp.]
MPLVNVMVNSRAYTIACDDGEEAHLRDLAAHVDHKVKELLGSVGQVGDQRLLLMAALLIADEHHEVAAQLHLREKELGALSGTHEDVSGKLAQSEGAAADAFEAATARLEELSAQIGHA